MSDRIAVVDEHNRFVRWTDRRTIHRERLPHRTVHVVIFDSEGRQVIQQRSEDKDTWGGYWDMACCGHVERDDYPSGPDDDVEAVYDDVARRELKEELGIETELTRLGWFPPTEGVHYEHIGLYVGVHDGPYTLQPEEVQAVGAATAVEYDEMVSDPEVKLTGALMHFTEWLRARGRFVAGESAGS